MYAVIHHAPVMRILRVSEYCTDMEFRVFVFSIDYDIVYTVGKVYVCINSHRKIFHVIRVCSTGV